MLPIRRRCHMASPTLSASSRTSAIADAVQTYVHDHSDAYLDLLTRIVQIESPSTDPEAQIGVQRSLAQALHNIGYCTAHLPGHDTGGSLYARPAQARDDHPRQLLLGHGDTVWPHGTLQRMPVRRDGDNLHGPGVFDMKAGLVSIVFALKALDAIGERPPLTPLVLVTSDEEIGSHESRHHIERLAQCSERVFVLEPALGLEGTIKTARKGTGEYVLCLRAAHTEDDPAATVNGSGNVVVELSRLVQHLHALNDPERGVTVNVGTIDGQHHADGAEGRLAVDVRVPTTDDAHRIDTTIQRLTPSDPSLALDVRGGMEREPMERTPGNQRLWQHAQRLGAHLGLSLSGGRAGGASDGNFTSLHTPTLDGLGAVGDGAHAQHEFIDVPRTLDRCALLALLLLTPPGRGSA